VDANSNGVSEFKSQQTNYRPIVDAFWQLCRQAGSDKEPAVAASYLLARLLPHVRSLGSRRVVTDSRLSNRRKAVADGLSILEDFLRADPLTPLTEVQFRASTKKAIGPLKMAPKAALSYLQFEETLLTEPCK
jgi:hypothetical protein